MDDSKEQLPIECRIFSFWPVCLATAFLFMLVFSLCHLTTEPRLWLDEAKNIEIAESFNTSGRLDMEISPGTFTGVAHLLQSTGYPVTVPLALVFKIFGFGLVQARLYMLLWMFAVVGILYIFLRNLFGNRFAVLATLLVVTFASFYDNGRPMMGEIPGFFFLLCALYFWLCRDSLWKAGVLFGLAVVSKPSVYLLIIPALFLTFLFRKNRFKNLAVVATSMLPAALGWVFLVMDHPFLKSAWLQIIDFYANPYNAIPIAQNVWKNIASIPHTPTVLYFGIFFIFLALARIWSRKEKSIFSLLYDFVLIYSVFAFVYYLRSPGWLRYTIVAELLILSLLPHALEIILSRLYGRFANIKICKKNIWMAVLLCIVAFQLFHLFTGAKIYFSDNEIKTADYIDKTFAGKFVAFDNALSVAIFKERNFRYMNLADSVVPVLSKNNTFQNISPLALPVLPDAVVAPKGEIFTSAESDILVKNYEINAVMGGYIIYVKK
jgi:hypothetical protein